MYHIILYALCIVPVVIQGYHQTTLVQLDTYAEPDQQLEQFLEPVTFTQEGFKRFFTHYYNTQRYVQEFLPCCFVHVLDFLAHARTTPDPHAFALATCDVFHQRLKATTWVNPYALLMLLEHMPDNLSALCQYEDQEQAYRTIVYDAILHEFSTLKQDPDAFLDTTAQRLKQQEDARYTKLQLQQRATQFIESALDKLIWSPNEQIATWHTFCAIGKQIEIIHQHGIIPDETSLNHLLWSLVNRFGYFLEYAGRYVSEDTYIQMRNEVDDQAPFLSTYDELESYITDKREYILSAFSHGYAQSLARKRGIM